MEPNSCIVNSQSRFVGGKLPDGTVILSSDKQHKWFTSETHHNQLYSDYELKYRDEAKKSLRDLEPDNYVVLDDGPLGGKLPDGTVVLHDDRLFIWFTAVGLASA